MCDPSESAAAAVSVAVGAVAIMRVAMAPFVLVEHLHQGAAFSLERARDERDGSAVVLKRLAPERSSPAEAARLRREHEILRSLELSGVAAVRGLFEEAGALTLVLRDFGGVNLASWLQAEPRSLLTRLEVAIRLAAVVGELHRHGVIHKDIKPRNILVDPAGEVQLIDFGIATRVSRELPALRSPTVLEGTLAYIAPEQTGRMNRPIDHRSDLYSLGATLYELLVGRPPFSGDALELVHAHIARVPVAPADVDPAIPAALSDIVGKLLAKAAEDRYRSAEGLRADLLRCREALAQGLSLGTFPLGQEDPAPGFALPDRLLGREAEVAALAAAHARVRGGACELAIVRGPAGVGKSAVIRELHRELGGGACILGKFDPLRRDQPYSGVCEALTQLVDAALASSEEGLARARWELERTLGKRGGPLVELLPGAAALLGPRAAAEPAGITGMTPAAARSRTHGALLGLVRAFSGPHRPLVLELEDLQWADAASLELLTALLTDAESQGLLVLGSYREAEVGPEHPLRRALTAIAASGRRITELTLGPLDGEAVASLCAEALGRAIEDPELRALAAVVHDRGGGLPLLCGEFLRDLDRSGLLRPASERRGFVWELATVVAAATSADVVTRMVERTRGLDDDARGVLRLAACLGGSFAEETLQALAGRPAAAIAAALREATEAGFLVAVAGRHRFFHDRVQQAVLDSLEPLARARHHLAIARHFKELRGAAAAFEVADHYNLALALLEEPEERRALAELDLAAARRARASGAFAGAVAYASAGLAALAGAVEEHALVHALQLLRAESLFVTGDFAAAEAGFAALLADARDDRERAVVYDLQVNLRVHRGELQEALTIGLAGLQRLGLELRRKPGVPTLIAEFLRTRAAIGKRSPEELLALPVLRDEDVRQKLRLLYSISGAAFQIDFTLMIQIALRTTRMSLTHGNSPLAAAEYISYGLMIGPITGDRRRMDAYGRAALTLLERQPDRGVEALVRFLYGSLIQCNLHPIRESFAMLREGHQCGVDTGNLMYASLCLSSLTGSMWTAGCPIEQVEEELGRTLAFARAHQVTTVLRTIGGLRGLLAWFRGAPEPVAEAEAEATTASVDEARVARHMGWQMAIERALHEGPGAGALALAEEAERDVSQVLPGPALIQHHAHRALLLARDHAGRGAIGRLQAVRAMQGCARKLAAHAEENPANFAALQRFVAAELARVQGEEGQAIRGYEQAAEAARDHGFVQQEALICVTAARFYQGAGLPELARVYLLRARRAYQRWGAEGRVAALDRLHPGLERGAAAALAETPGASAARAGSQPPGNTTLHLPLALDFASLFKATQAFAEEIELDRLLDKIMAIVVENAGAARGVLLLERDQGLVGARSFAIDEARSVDLGGAPLASVPAIPVALVYYVQRTGKAVAVADLVQDPRFADDPHVRAARPRSGMCAPLLHQGQRLGALYLENSLSAGVFDDQRLEALNVLAVQAAIAIEHALFYTRLDAARQAAEAANLAKTRFLANMSHELRTPLNAILGYSELLAEEATLHGSPEMIEDCARVRQAGVHLNGLISDILDLTKIEADRLDLGHEPIVLASLLAELLAMFGPELARGRQRLIEAHAEELGTMTGDPIRIRQVLLNLLSNAVKFGGPTITLRASRGATRVRFEVEDDGPGMREEQLARIFEPFTQLDTSATRRRDGAGLGLTICRSLCERMGGSISVVSAPGQGTTFAVELPLRPGLHSASEG